VTRPPTPGTHPAGPFDTEREARAAAHAAIPPAAGRSILTAAESRQMLSRTLEDAGVRMGRYDDRIAEWLTQWEDATVAVIAGWVQRAATRPWECPLCRSLFERPGFEHEPCRADLEPARLRADVDQLRRQLASALTSIRILDRMRPTCVLCHDAAADRQTVRGPACSDCVGDLPDDGPDPDHPETWAFPGPEDFGPGPVTPSPWGRPEPPHADDPDEPANRDLEPDPADWHDGPDPEPQP
jgi:hypothetical protein